LNALKDYIQKHYEDPQFLLSSQGILSVLSQEMIDKYRNGAAHTTVFAKERAQESFEFVINTIARMLDGLKTVATE
jgi:hypothetical protein